MLKKMIVSALVAATALSVSTMGFAAENDGSVEISFKVGDSVLSINGNDVEVEKPFIAGDGVTMVPLRVITEAFGSEVQWDGDTQTITITYPDVTLEFVVGSKSVKVNDHMESLEEAPVILGDGVTMVPLRFISETFGADVSWDSETGGITVVKTVSEDTGTTITGAVDADYITDSYYSWTMKYPKSLTITDRSFDGRKTYIESENSGVAILIYDREENDTYESILSLLRTASIGDTVSKSEVATNASGEKYAVYQSKSDSGYFATYGYMNDKYLYMISCVGNADSKSEFDDLVSIAETFTLKSVSSDSVQDLSNVVDGYRTFENKDEGISFSVPSDWMKSDYSSSDVFAKDTDNANGSNAITSYVFSAGDGVTARSEAIKDRDERIEFGAEAYTTVSDLEETTVDGHNAYAYTVTIDGTKYNDYVMYDLFIENEDYVNNITIRVPSEDVRKIDVIKDSIKVTKIDSEAQGTIIRDLPSDDVYIDYDLGNIKFSISERWTIVPTTSDTITGIDARTSSALIIGKLPKSDNIGNNYDIAKALYDSYINNGYDSVIAPETVNIKTKSYYRYAVSIDRDNSRGYLYEYVFSDADYIYYVSVYSDEYVDKEYTNALAEDIMSRMK